MKRWWVWVGAAIVGCGGRVEPLPQDVDVPPPRSAEPEEETTGGGFTEPHPALSDGDRLAPSTCVTLRKSIEGGSPTVRIAMVDLDTGNVDVGPVVPGVDGVTSLGRLDGKLLACPKTHNGVLEIGRDGLWERRGYKKCSGVTTNVEGIWLFDPTENAYSRYPNFRTLEARMFDVLYLPELPPVDVIGPARGGLLGSWSKDHFVMRYGDGSNLATVAEASRGPVIGISETSGGRVVVSLARAEGGDGSLEIFDASTQQRLRSISTGGTDMMGLFCGM